MAPLLPNPTQLMFLHQDPVAFADHDYLGQVANLLNLTKKSKDKMRKIKPICFHPFTLYKCQVYLQFPILSLPNPQMVGFLEQTQKLGGLIHNIN